MNRRNFLKSAGAIAVSAALFRNLPAPAPLVHAGDTRIRGGYGPGSLRPGDKIAINGELYLVTHAAGDRNSGCLTLDRPIVAKHPLQVDVWRPIQ